ITAAPSPDLTAFKNHGGKLIQFAGWNDSVVPPDGSVNYYHSLALFEELHTLPSPIIDAIVNNLSPQDVALTAQFLGDRVRQYHRLFLLPAVAHCGGSTGPSSIGGGMPEPPAAFRDADHHVVSAVIRWSSKAATQLAFSFRSDPGFWYLDDVSVSAVPEPEQWALMVAGLSMIAVVRRR